MSDIQTSEHCRGRSGHQVLERPECGWLLPHAAHNFIPSPLAGVKEGLTVRSGDTLVLRVADGTMSDEEVRAMLDKVRPLLPEGAQVLAVAGDGVDIAVVRRD